MEDLFFHVSQKEIFQKWKFITDIVINMSIMELQAAFQGEIAHY